MKILVCGGRSYGDVEKVFEILDCIHTLSPIAYLVHGNAKGADRLAEDWAIQAKVCPLSYPADWNRHGKSAGPKRNRQMLDENPDVKLVVAFPGGAGTENMTTLAKARNIRVMEILG